MKHKQSTTPLPAWGLKTGNASLIMHELDKCRPRRYEAIQHTMKGFLKGTKSFDKSAKSSGKGEKGRPQRATHIPDKGNMFLQELDATLRPILTQAMAIGFDMGFAEGFEKGFAQGFEQDDLSYGKCFQRGFAKGFDSGFSLGFDEGRIEGNSIGFDRGFEQGFDKGDKGFSKGFDKGFQQGIEGFGNYAQGFDEGFKKGFEHCIESFGFGNDGEQGSEGLDIYDKGDHGCSKGDGKSKKGCKRNKAEVDEFE